MPTMVMTALPTMPLPRADAMCAWCQIRLAAIPEAPKPVFADDGTVVHVHYCCAGPYRNDRAGIPRL
jgi:hypothetical protein